MASPNKPRSTQADSAGDSTPLAERLFVARWNAMHGSGCDKTAELAKECIDAAEVFNRVRSEQSE